MLSTMRAAFWHIFSFAFVLNVAFDSVAVYLTEHTNMVDYGVTVLLLLVVLHANRREYVDNTN